MPNFDLHTHSNASDGLLAPADLVKRAASQGVTVLALTDHDDVGGLAEARRAAADLGLAFVNGVEISVSWNRHTIHVVGLHIDPENPVLQAGLGEIRAGRMARARRIASALEERGIPGSLEGARSFATNPHIIGRTHFARFLVESGRAKDVRTVFKKYLVKGKPGYVSHEWAKLEDAVAWIRAAGGIAVLAHPGRYQVGRASMEALLSDFKGAGGGGIEVITGSHTPEQFPVFAEYASKYGLLASRGSDFHGPGESYTELGRLPELPSACKPVWHDWVNRGA